MNVAGLALDVTTSPTLSQLTQVSGRIHRYATGRTDVWIGIILHTGL